MNPLIPRWKPNEFPLDGTFSPGKLSVVAYRMLIIQRITYNNYRVSAVLHHRHAAIIRYSLIAMIPPGCILQDISHFSPGLWCPTNSSSDFIFRIYLDRNGYREYRFFSNNRRSQNVTSGIFFFFSFWKMIMLINRD